MIPLITKEVCSTLNIELQKEGLGCLTQTIENLESLQPHLFQELSQGSVVITAMHGIAAGEASLRLALVVYKLVESQLDVNQLEELL